MARGIGELQRRQAAAAREAVLAAVLRLGPRATLRRVADEIGGSHYRVQRVWHQLADRGLCPPPVAVAGPPGVIRDPESGSPDPPSAEEIALACEEVRAGWGPRRLGGDWSVPTVRVCSA